MNPLSDDIVRLVAEWSSRRALHKLCTVSRGAHSAASPMLYRTIYLEDLSHRLELLVSTLNLSLVHHIRNLVIAGSVVARHQHAFVKLVGATARLVSLEIEPYQQTFGTHSSVVSALQLLYLEHLSLSNMHAEHINPLLANIPTIERLRLPETTAPQVAT